MILLGYSLVFSEMTLHKYETLLFEQYTPQLFKNCYTLSEPLIYQSLEQKPISTDIACLAVPWEAIIHQQKNRYSQKCIFTE